MAKERIAAQAGLVAAGAVFIFCLSVLFSQGGDKTAASASSTANVNITQRSSSPSATIVANQP